MRMWQTWLLLLGANVILGGILLSAGYALTVAVRAVTR
jgi:hypothetical protein